MDSDFTQNELLEIELLIKWAKNSFKSIEHIHHLNIEQEFGNDTEMYNKIKLELKKTVNYIIIQKPKKWYF